MHCIVGDDKTGTIDVEEDKKCGEGEDNDDDNDSNVTPVKGSHYAPLGARSGKSTKKKDSSGTDMYNSKKKKSSKSFG